jgi:predicted aspartyl protease
MKRALAPLTFAAMLFGPVAWADPGDAPPPASPPAQSCTLGQIASLDMSMEPGGNVDVPVLINDRPVRLTVDTGALISIISSSVADELQLERKRLPGEFMLLGGVKSQGLAIASTLKIGHMTGKDMELVVLPASAFIDFGYEGLLGPDILSQFDVEFDYAHAKLNFFSQDHCDGKVVYWAKNSTYARIPFTFRDKLHISLPVTLDGKTLSAAIDTGAERSIMPLKVAQSLGVDINAPGVTHEIKSVNGTALRPLYHYPFGALSLDGINISHPDIDIVPDADMGGIQLLLGAATLRQLRLYIAYKEKAIYVTPAEAQ